MILILVQFDFNGKVEPPFSENLGKIVRVKTLYAKGGCPKSHKQGEEFVFDSSSLSFCPKALDGLFPYIQLLERGERLPWSRDGEPNILKCPYADCGNVELEVEFVDKKPLTTAPQSYIK